LISNNNIDSYNQNIYINILKSLFIELASIKHFLKSIENNKDFKNINDLGNYYKGIFSKYHISEHIVINITKIYKPLYLSNPGEKDKGNSYHHIKLKIVSDELNWLDTIYNGILSRLLKFYKHFFSKIDNYYITHNTSQLEKYGVFLETINSEVSKFLEYSQHREHIEQREKLKQQDFEKIPFGGLFYIAHIKNIESILQLGVLSHNLAHSKGIVNVDISNQSVNIRRNRIEESLGGNIHDFAPLFIHPRNPTFYYWCMNEKRENLILLRINPHILLRENVAFSDGNAAVKSTNFYNNIDDFNKLEWEIIKENYWGKHPDGKRIKCSEVLVKEKIPLYYINNIFVYNETTLNKILHLFPNHLGIKTGIKKELYF